VSFEWSFLSDPTRGLNSTPVFIKTDISIGAIGAMAALKFLQDRLQPTMLRRVSSSEHNTVVLALDADPRIRIGRAMPTGSSADDEREILQILASHGLLCIVT